MEHATALETVTDQEEVREGYVEVRSICVPAAWAKNKQDFDPNTQKETDRLRGDQIRHNSGREFRRNTRFMSPRPEFDSTDNSDVIFYVSLYLKYIWC